MSECADILQGLYDSEINWRVSTFWDAGFDWWLGDDMNGYKAEGCADTFKDACEELAKAAITYFPESDFARVRTCKEKP